MSLQPLLLDGAWTSSHHIGDAFQATDPSTGERLPPRYPVSSFADLDRMLEAAEEAAAALRSTPPEAIADFLDTYATRIEARASKLVKWAHRETGLLKVPRLANGELPRTTDQLRQAAEAVRERSWRMATLDTECNIRSIFEPLGGPVVVMGPNNFPFAFNGISGGDFAAALAAGNPVIAKAHPSHPTTTRLFAEAALEALKATDLPPATVQLFYHTQPESGLKLVAHPQVGATAFTGSRRAGLALKAAADKAGKPIYLEMSSVNPVFLLPGALEERPTELVEELATSCMLGAGQFCTNPGLVILPEGKTAKQFARKLADAFEATEEGLLLTSSGSHQIAEAIAMWQQHGAELLTGGKPIEGPGYRFQHTLLQVSGDRFIEHAEALQTEAFGTASLLIFARDVEQMIEIAARRLENSLTGCIYSHTDGADDVAYRRLASALRERVGRLLNDKMPTGVAVSSAMVHGGPYPSTGHPGFTAVGIPPALRRFAAMRCYDNVRPHRLPPELQDENPTGEMWRFIDGTWTQQDAKGQACGPGRTKLS